MDRQAFKNRMQQLKQYREQNPGKTYLDWRYSSDRTDHPVSKPTVVDLDMHTTPDGEYNSMYNSFEDTYYAGSLPQVTVTAPLTEQAQRNIEARRGASYVDEGRRKAAPYVGAIVAGAALPAMASTGGLGTAVDIASIASNPIDPLNYISKFSSIPKVLDNYQDYRALKQFMKKYNYTDIKPKPSIIFDSDALDRTTKHVVERHNTFVRGVDVAEAKKLGYIPENMPDEEAARKMLVTIPNSTGSNTAGLLDWENALYTSNDFGTAAGYTNSSKQGYIGIVRRPIKTGQTTRREFIKDNDFDFYTTPGNNMYETSSGIYKGWNFIKGSSVDADIFRKAMKDTPNITELEQQVLQSKSAYASSLSRESVSKFKKDYYDYIQAIKNTANQKYGAGFPMQEVRANAGAEALKGRKGDNGFRHYLFVGKEGDTPVELIDLRRNDQWTGHKAHMGQPSIGLSRKFADGGETGDDLTQYNDNTRVSAGKPTRYRHSNSKVAEENKGYGLTTMLPFVGDALDAADTYEAIKNKDWLGTGLALFSILPFIPSSVTKLRRTVPTVNKNLTSDLIDKQLQRESKDLALRTKTVNEVYNTIERLMDDPAYLHRAEQVRKQFGTDYSIPYADAFMAYNVNPAQLPNVKLLDDNIGATRAGQMTKHNKDSFTYGVSKVEHNMPNVTEHEMSHYMDLLQTGDYLNAEAGNNMFYQMSKDLNKKVDSRDRYYSNPSEQKAHMNQLREYMFQNGMLSNRGDVVSEKMMKDVLNKIKDVRGLTSVLRASKQFKSIKTYTKWFNSIPLLGVGAAAMYDNKQE